jgi:hypothetical protein
VFTREKFADCIRGRIALFFVFASDKAPVAEVAKKHGVSE